MCRSSHLILAGMLFTKDKLWSLRNIKTSLETPQAESSCLDCTLDIISSLQDSKEDMKANRTPNYVGKNLQTKKQTKTKKQNTTPFQDEFLFSVSTGLEGPRALCGIIKVSRVVWRNQETSKIHKHSERGGSWDWRFFCGANWQESWSLIQTLPRRYNKRSEHREAERLILSGIMFPFMPRSHVNHRMGAGVK